VSALVSSGVHHQTFHYRRGGDRIGVPFQFERGRNWQTVCFHATKGRHNTALGKVARKWWQRLPWAMHGRRQPKVGRTGQQGHVGQQVFSADSGEKTGTDQAVREIEPRVVWANVVRKRIRLLWKNVNEVGYKNHLAQVKCHTPVVTSRTKASIHVPRIFKSHA
jgi:hypothetical protein